MDLIKVPDRLFEWTINKAVVDFESIENDYTKESLLACKFAAHLSMYSESIKKLPQFNLLYDAVFMDTGTKNLFIHESFLIPFDPFNTANKITAYCQDKNLKFSIISKFSVNIDDSIDDPILTDWIHDNQIWTYITPCGPWAYSSDEGGHLKLVK